MSEPSLRQIQELASALCGTCGGPSENMLDEHKIDPDFRDDIGIRLESDGEIFLCSDCGWWCENTEMDTDTGDQLCGDCAEDRRDS